MLSYAPVSSESRFAFAYNVEIDTYSCKLLRINSIMHEIPSSFSGAKVDVRFSIVESCNIRLYHIR